MNTTLEISIPTEAIDRVLEALGVEKGEKTPSELKTEVEAILRKQLKRKVLGYEAKKAKTEFLNTATL